MHLLINFCKTIEIDHVAIEWCWIQFNTSDYAKPLQDISIILSAQYECHLYYLVKQENDNQPSCVN
jgi:hypothetical protein